MKPTILITFFFLPIFLFGQDSPPSTFKQKLENFKVQPVVGLQLWSSYTFGTAIYNQEKGIYETVDNRLNTQIRRTRLGVKGQPYENLKFNFTASLDLVGKDNLSGTESVGNNGGSPAFRIWNAYLQWRIIPKKEALNITAGYLPPQMGRESINSALRVTSMEKSWSQNYLRRHLVGTGAGRAVGFNFGGLLRTNKKVSFKYDVGIFNPVFESYQGNSTGKQSSPLFVGRVLINLGDTESNKYTVSHKVNYFGKRKGLSVAISGAMQGETDLFTKNYAFGSDFLLNYGNLNLDGEWSLLWRSGTSENATESFTVAANTGYFRMSYNIDLKNGYVIEPSLMWVQFNGETSALGQNNAALVNSLSGKDHNWDLGVNLYFNPDFKLSLHYTLRNADAGSAGEGATVNNYFFESGVGAFRRGDWLGLGLVTIF